MKHYNNKLLWLLTYILNVSCTNSDGTIDEYNTCASLILLFCIVLTIVVELAIKSSRREKKEKIQKSAQLFSQQLVQMSDFTITAEAFSEDPKNRILFDEGRKELMIVTGGGNGEKRIPFSKIISVEVKEDGVILNRNGKIIQRSLVGYALGGAAGAVIGGTTANKNERTQITSVQLIVKFADLSYPSFVYTALSPIDLNIYHYLPGEVEHAQQQARYAADLLNAAKAMV